jgi:GrpB-like predicted nucleotidyltransferase (UPF0157 family)
VDYDSRWPGLYEVEKQRVLALIGDKIEAIEHFGSTSVPGMCGKPCIDAVAGVKDMSISRHLKTILGRLGYHYVAHAPDQLWQIVGREGSVSFRLHIVPHEGRRWNGFLALRDYLRSHRSIALEYCRRKRRLAMMHRLDPRTYYEGKREFIESTEAQARLSPGSARTEFTRQLFTRRTRL